MKDLHSQPKIEASGHYDLPNEVYHGDCCAGPSLSSTTIKQLLRDPADFWRESALNPDRVEREHKQAFNVGTAAHTMVLEPDLLADTIAVVPSEMLASNGALSTKAAKQFVADQTDLGRTVVKPDEWEAVCSMADAIRSHPVAMRAIRGGVIEQSLIVHDEDAGLFIKSRPDVMPVENGRFIVDLKTSALTDIDRWEKTALLDLGYGVQAALMMWALEKVTGVRAAGVMFVVVCKEAPHRVAIRTIRPDTESGRAILDNAWLDIRRAIAIFRECWASGEWPSKWDSVTDITPPDWHLRQIEKRLESEGYNSPFAEWAA